MKAGSRSVAWEETLSLATLLVVSLIAAAPLWGPGLLNTRGGGDSPFLLLRTHQLAANLRAGVFPVRWMPDAAYGLGYPFFSYYAALPYTLAAGFTLAGLDILTAIKLTQTLFFAAAAWGMYRWAEGILRSRPGAWLAAVAYTVAPFHLVNVYVRGDSLSEFAAFAFYPLILWGLDGLASKPSLRRVPLPALAYAGLILTHNASALIFSPFILLYVALHSAGLHDKRPSDGSGGFLPRLSFLLVALSLGLLLSAWFWLPALAETGYVQLEAQTTGYFFYGNHFRGSGLIQWAPVFDYATAADRPSPFAMGAVQAAVALAGILVTIPSIIRSLVRSRHGTSETPKRLVASQSPTWPSRAGLLGLGFGALGLLLSTWLITPVSLPLWEHLPLLDLVQFPWRFLSVQALFTALFGGAVVACFDSASRPDPSRTGTGSVEARRRAYRRRGSRGGVWAGAGAMGVIVTTTALVGLRPAYLPIRANEVTAERLQLYELFTGNIGSTIRHEYLPRWVRPRPYAGPSHVTPDAPARAMPVSGELLGAERVVRRPTRRVWRVEAGAAGAHVAFPLVYWPGWRARVDGAPVEVGPTPGSGYLSVAVPAGAHTVEVWLGRTQLRLGSELTSLATALMMLGVWILAGRQEAKVAAGAADRRTGRGRFGSRWYARELAMGGLPFIAVLALLIVLQPRVSTSGNDDLTMDFEEKPYLHHNPNGVAFDDWRMLGYGYGAERIAPGEALQVTLDWTRNGNAPVEVAPDEEATLRVVSPAAVRREMVPPIAQATIDLGPDPGAGAGRTTLNLPVPPDAAPGLHLVEVAGRQRVFLKPVWIASGESAAGRMTQAAFADGKVHLHSIAAAQRSAERLDVQLDWSAAEPVAANYGLSLSLKDTGGNEWLRQGGGAGYDTQPGHGFLPTSLWPVGAVLVDRHAPGLQAGAPPGEDYTFIVRLYRVGTWESVGAHKVTVSVTEAARRPDAPIVARLTEEVALSRIGVAEGVQQGETLQVTAYWVAVGRPARDYSSEWRLGMAGHTITSTQPLAPGSSPTDWPVGAWVAGRGALSIPPKAPAGEYRLSLVLRDPASGAVVGSYTHPETVWVQERERVWAMPPVEHRVGARFGGMIELVGYSLAQSKEGLELTLHWRALATPDRHYMFFVHLADPETGRPVAQVDTMPRSFTYPTGMWAPGEIVSDEVRLSVEDVASGRYDLAVGWYDPETQDRLPAVGSQGVPLPDDRLLLPGGIRLP